MRIMTSKVVTCKVVRPQTLTWKNIMWKILECEQKFILYDTMIPEPIWALDSDSTVWPMTPTPYYLRPEPEPKIAASLGLMLPQSLMSKQS